MYSYWLFRQFYIIKNSPQALRSAAPRAPAPPVRMIVRHCRASARKQSFPAGRHAFRSRGTGIPVRSAASAVLAGTGRVVEALAVRALELGVAHLVAKIRVGRSAHRRAARAAVCPDLPTAVLALGAGRRRRRLCLAGRAERRQQLPDSTTDQDPHDAQQKQMNESTAAEVWLRLAPATDRRRPRPSRL